jgi:hypothetical protein
MTATAAVVVALVLAVLLLAGRRRGKGTAVGGLVYRDPKGRLVLILTPATKGRRRK